MMEPIVHLFEKKEIPVTFDTQYDSRLDITIYEGENMIYFGQGGRVIMFGVTEWEDIKKWIDAYIRLGKRESRSMR